MELGVEETLPVATLELIFGQLDPGHFFANVEIWHVAAACIRSLVPQYRPRHSGSWPSGGRGDARGPRDHRLDQIGQTVSPHELRIKAVASAIVAEEVVIVAVAHG